MKYFAYDNIHCRIIFHTKILKQITTAVGVCATIWEGCGTFRRQSLARESESLGTGLNAEEYDQPASCSCHYVSPAGLPSVHDVFTVSIWSCEPYKPFIH